LLCIFLHSLLPRSSYAYIFSSTPYSQTHSAYFLPQCERPSFSTIQNNRQNYSYVYLNIYNFG
jgi:hypothetical protein